MRKRLSSVLAFVGLLSLAGCSSSQNEAARIDKTESPIVAARTSSVPVEPPVLAREQTSQAMGRSAGSGRGVRPEPSYRHEVESANYLFAQNKSASSPRIRRTSRPGGHAIAAEGASYRGEDGAAVADKNPELDLYKMAMAEPLSTFSADVDTASYANFRRLVKAGRKPRPDEVRLEEMVNYFTYDLPEPKAGQPFSVTSELTECPWNDDARLLRLAIKTPSIDRDEKPPCNLVFLLDVSGSMEAPDKLPLLKSSLKTLVDSLDDADRIAIVVYAGDSGVALPSTPASDKAKILEAIDSLHAGGSTNGASGLQLAYQIAAESGAEGAVNRVILATDGDFNVGVSSEAGLKQLIEEKRKSGIFLSVLGFGSNGYNDQTMETLADNGNGNYASIDSLDEARKVLVEESGANLVTVAKDVKFQFEFDPKQVKQYRLLGYKNRRLANADFANDKKDAGDLGAGHAVTVLYEIVPTQGESGLKQTLLGAVGMDASANLGTVRLRYKAPDDDSSELLELPVTNSPRDLSKASADHRWAVAVSGLGLTLDGDPEGAKISLQGLTKLAKSAAGADPYRKEFLSLMSSAQKLASL